MIPISRPSIRRFLLPFLAVAVAAAGCLPLVAASLRTLAFDLPENPVTLRIAAAGSEETVAAEVRLNRYGEPLTLAPGTYRAVSDQFQGEAAFVIPSGVPRLILLVLPGPDGGCQLVPLPDDADRFGPGDRYVLNATAEEIAIRFGASQSRLPPGRGTHLAAPHPAPEDGRVEVEMSRLIGERWQAFNSTYWPLDPLARSFVLIHPDPRTGNPRVRSLSEVPDAVTP